MEYKSGDRVICVHDTYGTKAGEFGTIQEAPAPHHILVCWDNYYKVRHNNGGRCERGHGWLVDDRIIESVQERDLGDFCGMSIDEVEALLFS